MIKIGTKEYSTKRDAITHYRSILNSYDFGQSLNGEDLLDLIDLLNYYPNENEISTVPKENTLYVTYIKVSKVQFGTRCFEVFYEDGTSCYISYRLCINGKSYSDSDLFYTACRSAVSADIHAVKSRYFKGSVNRMAVCQETGILSKWEELVIDHRQPNTFSVIVDRFIELNNIDLSLIKYQSDKNNNIIFTDNSLSEQFMHYHREKANLRVVRRECNSGRIGLSRLKRTSKDLIINDKCEF
jgi:hypothetical protein